jgi:hypothetical protein
MANSLDYYKYFFSSKENLNAPNNKLLIRNNQNQSSLTNINTRSSLTNNLKFQSPVKQRTNRHKNNNSDNFNLKPKGEEINNNNNKINILNPIKEHNCISKNKKKQPEVKMQKSQDKKVNNKNMNISSSKNNEHNKKPKICKKENNNANKNTYKGFITKNKEIKTENNNKNKSQNKNNDKKNNKINIINNNNNNANACYNNSTINNKKDNPINAHYKINKSSSTGEIFYNKNTSNDMPDNNRMSLNKKVICRNDRLKNEGHSELSTKKKNHKKSKINLKQSNSPDNIERNNNIKNRNNCKNKKDVNINVNETKKIIVNKGKINNK